MKTTILQPSPYLYNLRYLQYFMNFCRPAHNLAFFRAVRTPLFSRSSFTRRAIMSTTSSSPQAEAANSHKPRYVDIGINLTDPVYSGIYYETQRHPADLPSVLSRARAAGCEKLIVTGSDLEESRKAVELSKEHPGFLFATVGVHPCSCLQFTKAPNEPGKYLAELEELAHKAKDTNHCVAFGEIGLDYDRLTLCPKDAQLEYFEKQLDIATRLHLPLFLHSRAAHEDFVRILKARLGELPRKGVVHSFTGTKEEMLELVELGFDIGVNGCSLKTEENLEVVKAIPLERIQLETDGPWCEIRPSHASAVWLKKYEEEGMAEEEKKVEGGKGWKSVKKEKWVEGCMVKGRNEPCMIGRVAWIVAGVRGMNVQELREKAWENSCRMFDLGA
ncbi:deoxyribonuclease Tat-D protein [Rutstroemia sp. NJR-2017a WRK4]|nr:deoxyribonuclease Tat-D protein [Rutstroemia sp. NJR-2017a WRK4]